MPTLDVRGKVCPYPVIAALEGLHSLSTGKALEILTDEPLALRSVPEEAKRLGLSTEIQKVENGWKIIIKK